MKIIIYIFLIVTFVSGCKDQLPVQSPTNNNGQNTSSNFIHNVTLQLGSFVYVDTLFADSAQVIIDDSLETQTDFQGQLTFDSLRAGLHKIMITHSLFSDFGQTVNIQKNEVFIPLTSLVDDYFPLHVGSKWKYSYSLSTYVQGNGNSSDSGLVSWKVTTIEENGAEKRYIVNVGFQKATVNGYSPKNDSTMFEFIEAENHRISIEQIDSSGNKSYFLCKELQSMLNQDTVYRYYPKLNSDKIHFYAWTDGVAGTDVYIKRHSGVDSYSYGFTATNLWKYNTNYNLVLFDKPQINF